MTFPKSNIFMGQKQGCGSVFFFADPDPDPAGSKYMDPDLDPSPLKIDQNDNIPDLQKMRIRHKNSQFSVKMDRF